MDISTALTHQTFGDLVGISKQAVGQMVAEGTLVKGDVGSAWLLTYCARLRGYAAARASEESLASMRAHRALAVSRTVAQDIKNTAAQVQYAPIHLLAQVLDWAAQAVASHLDTLVSTLMSEGVELSDSQRIRIASIVARARNEFLERATTMKLLGLFDDQVSHQLDLHDESLEAETVTAVMVSTR